MKPLAVLLAAFFVALVLMHFMHHYWALVWAGNIAMSIMLLFTASGHFIYADGMVMMMPGFLPQRRALVYGSGIFEALCAVALLIPACRYAAGIALIIFFILALPANIYAAVNNIDYQSASDKGPGFHYLAFRMPLQLFFILWVYGCALR